ncbi:hypothetical protein Cni_G04116 [Canna indica]|uniref:BHLH domain-containing protein n=1 Tax=Canna indica TaxID=4628 RepID=A0AAQ3Q465_9LILI|nr:hypothetical protein Cni_G04116 [Canna indica]
MYGSPPVPPSKDLNLPYRRHHHQQQQQTSSSLLRYQSAPITLLGEVCEDFIPVRGSSAETDTVFARFLAPDLRDQPRGGAATTGQSSPRFPSSSSPQMPNPSSEMKSVDLGSSSDLVRHDSSPGGLFPHSNVDHNGYGMARGTGGFRNGSDYTMDAANRSKGQIIFLPAMSEITESSLKDGRSYTTGFPVVSPFGNSFPLDSQFSLPKTTLEMEKLLQFHDAVPCKIRAKRGCATHPRSIAERVRRTRISERMKKLQELVPNMDKQTNTADMLDLAVDYIKDLQKQAKALSESRASCSCSASRQKH